MLDRLIENKNLIIAGLQLVIIIGLIVYFNKRNNKLVNQIQDLTQRIDEQDDLIQKHEDIIKKLIGSLNKVVQSTQLSSNHSQTNEVVNKAPVKPVVEKRVQQSNIKPLESPVRVSINSIKKENLPDIIEEEDDGNSSISGKSNTSENLDSIISAELLELE